jgi:hypothetical protein
LTRCTRRVTPGVVVLAVGVPQPIGAHPMPVAQRSAQQ